MPIQSTITEKNKLKITEVTARIDGKKKTLRNNQRISDRVRPGSSVDFKVTVRNEFQKNFGLDIVDTKVKVTIDSIDRGDDLEEESNSFDLRPGSDKSVTLKFKIPLKAEEDDYGISIDADGEDTNNTEHNDNFESELKVKGIFNETTGKVPLFSSVPEKKDVNENEKTAESANTARGEGAFLQITPLSKPNEPGQGRIGEFIGLLLSDKGLLLVGILVISIFFVVILAIILTLSRR